VAVSVDVHELTEVLELTPGDQNIMLVGRHGIGKSQVITEFYEQRGLRVIPFFLGQMSDPGDLIGLPHKNLDTGRSEFLPPYWWPLEGQPVVLFLDELNRARPEILQAVMDLALNKTLAGKQLPAGSILVSAINEGDEYLLTEMDPALVSRFNVYRFEPTVEDWLVWAARHRLDARLIRFIQTYPHFLDGIDPGGTAADVSLVSTHLRKTPDRRAWARVSRMLEPIDDLKPVHMKLIAGVIGGAAASAFRKDLQNTQVVSAEQTLLNWDKVQNQIQTLPLADCLALNEQMVIWICGGHCPADRADQARDALLAYFRLLRHRKMGEAVAHWVSLTDQSGYAPALDWVAESMELTDLLTQYIEGVHVS